MILMEREMSSSSESIAYPRSRKLDIIEFRNFSWEMPSSFFPFTNNTGTPTSNLMDTMQSLEPDCRIPPIINYKEVMNYPKTVSSPRPSSNSLSLLDTANTMNPADSTWNASPKSSTIVQSSSEKMDSSTTSHFFTSHCIMCGRNDVDIPTQNKSICKHCDSSFWLSEAYQFVFKFCKGCKNFFPLSEFTDKPEGTKCVKCRERVKSHYLARKQQQQQCPSQSSKKSNTGVGIQEQTELLEEECSPEIIIHLPKHRNQQSLGSRKRKLIPSLSTSSDSQEYEESPLITTRKALPLSTPTTEASYSTDLITPVTTTSSATVPTLESFMGFSSSGKKPPKMRKYSFSEGISTTTNPNTDTRTNHAAVEVTPPATDKRANREDLSLPSITASVEAKKENHPVKGNFTQLKSLPTSNSTAIPLQDSTPISSMIFNHHRLLLIEESAASSVTSSVDRLSIMGTSHLSPEVIIPHSNEELEKRSRGKRSDQEMSPQVFEIKMARTFAEWERPAPRPHLQDPRDQGDTAIEGKSDDWQWDPEKNPLMQLAALLSHEHREED